MLTVLSFLQQYITHCPITFTNQPCIYMCCDNKGVLTRINNYQHQPINPNHTVFDKYGIYHAIHLINQTLPNLTIKYIHVLGHQDQRQSDQPLSLKAHLNIECDAAATQLHNQLNPTQYPKQHPLISTAYPCLLIHGQHVIRHVKQTLRDEYTNPTYITYLTKKHKWKRRIPKTIAWRILHLALNRFTATEQQILVKFLHGWLPLQMRPQVVSTSAEKLCPSCRQQPEDMIHFLSCQHTLHKPAFIKLQQQVQLLHHKHAVDPNLYQLLWQGITTTLLQHDLPNPHEHYHQQYISVFEDQQNIGWLHLMQGR